MLEHIGITINDKRDINKFYKGLLELEEVADFDISKEISSRIFDIHESTPITLLKRDNLILELFYCQNNTTPVYNHICLSVENRSDFLKKVQNAEYPIHIHQRSDKDDLVFIEDNSGNKFEIAGREKN